MSIQPRKTQSTNVLKNSNDNSVCNASKWHKQRIDKLEYQSTSIDFTLSIQQQFRRSHVATVCCHVQRRQIVLFRNNHTTCYCVFKLSTSVVAQLML